MEIVNHFPHAVRVIENVWIPMPDGCRLAARIWLPHDAQTHAVPAILEYIPYRKRDLTRARDEPMHHYFAGHGYAAVRVDVRGSGDSDGLLLDEYLRREQDDALSVIEWIAAQRWCDGAVGMMGKSWGGFNSLQVAARRPARLKAIITVCSTDDRYADDAHYMGGCLLNENLTWGSVLMGLNAYPPDPELVGERWRDMWLNRLEHAVLFPALWLQHQRRDDYWKHGSVCENYEAIQCPVYAIGGWADAYTNAIPRLLAGLKVPCKGLVGPWAHVYPHDGVPGPAIGFLQEALRWWEQWLRGVETGIMDEARYRVWMQYSVPPKPFYEERPGRWVAEPVWPSARITLKRWFLNPGRLAESAALKARLDFRSPQITGLAAGDWCGFGNQGEAPLDQRADDGRSLTFDSDVLDEPFEILGAPVVTLELAVDQSVAFVAVRLNDIAPDGESTRVTYGLLNLTHRDGHERPQAMEPGRHYRVQVRLNDLAHSFAPGHMLRVAISTSYWPVAWPAPRPVTLSVFTEGSFIDLPIRPPHADEARMAPFARPESAPAPAQNALQRASLKRTIERDLATNQTVYTIISDGGDLDGAAVARMEDIELDIGHTILKRFFIDEDDPLSARAEVVQKTTFHRGAWRTRIETRTDFSATAEHFLLEARLSAYEGEQQVFTRRWQRRIAREFV